MATAIDRLKADLLATKDGEAACDIIDTLTRRANKGDVQASGVLAEYVRHGRINHMRAYACSCLAESETDPHAEYAGLFREGLTDPTLRYWSILGYIRSAGKDSYKALAKIARDKTIPLDDRAHAIKCLAAHSKQPFDRQLPADPGYWKETDLRLSEVAAWAKKGFPDGQGYLPPIRDAALDHPRTPLEKIASRLDKKLAKKRDKHQDLANPTDWLAIATPQDMKRVKATWKLPSVYVDFLKRFSPVKVTLENRKFYNHFQLFGAGELMEAQQGYSYNPVEQQPIDDWPDGLVVIANHGGDPFVLNLAKSDRRDAPVETAEHGVGDWDFRLVASSFLEFLEGLAK